MHYEWYLCLILQTYNSISIHHIGLYCVSALPPLPPLSPLLYYALGIQATLDVSSKPMATPTDVGKLQIVTQIAFKWEDIAFALGVENCIINNISTDHSKDSKGTCREILDSWLWGEISLGRRSVNGPPSWQHLERQVFVNWSGNCGNSTLGSYNAKLQPRREDIIIDLHFHLLLYMYSCQQSFY